MTRLPGAEDRDAHARLDHGVGPALTLVRSVRFPAAAAAQAEYFSFFSVCDATAKFLEVTVASERNFHATLVGVPVHHFFHLWRCFMARFSAGPSCWLYALAFCCIMASVSVAKAVTVSFENPPYAVGGIVGQDGWAAAGYFPAPNGSLEVSATGPLSGGQSLSYTRTEAGLAANGTDVVKADVVTVAKDGTPAADLIASFLISSSSLSAQGMGFGLNGLYLSPAGVSGATPIGIRLNNAGSSIPSIEEIADFGGSPAFYYFGGSLAAAAFPENDVLEFDIDVDFDSSTYTVAYRNVTTGGPLTSSGFTRVFAVPYPANPNGTFDVDVIAAFRYGAGKIDDIELSGNIVPEPSTLAICVAAGVSAIGFHRKRPGTVR